MIFPGIFGIFNVFQNFYILILQFLMEPLTMFGRTLGFYETLLKKHSSKSNTGYYADCVVHEAELNFDIQYWQKVILKFYVLTVSMYKHLSHIITVDM